MGDYPSAHEFAAETELDDHAERCSYRTTERTLLCDCHVLDDEYARREALRRKLTEEVRRHEGELRALAADDGRSEYMGSGLVSSGDEEAILRYLDKRDEHRRGAET